MLYLTRFWSIFKTILFILAQTVITLVMANSPHCQIRRHTFLRFLSALQLRPSSARWLQLSVFLSASCVMRWCQPAMEGRSVPFLIRTVLAIINRCRQELKFGTNLSHFTVQQGQTEAKRKRERLGATRQDSFICVVGYCRLDFIGPYIGSLMAPSTLNDRTPVGLLYSLQSKR